MRIDTLRERIANAKAKIEKKQNTIVKKEALIEKKKATLVKMGFNPNAEAHEVRMYSMDAFWLICDIKSLREDIERLSNEITETQASLEKYEAQMVGEMEKEQALKEIPFLLKRMQDELVIKWDEWDREFRDKINEDHRTMDYNDFRKKYRGFDTYTLMYRTNDQIHNQNMQDAKVLILNLINRVKDITGEITDWSGIQATIGTHGFTVLNGIVIGKEGRAKIESIYAGGYNIQKLHVRVLVHEI